MSYFFEGLMLILSEPSSCSKMERKFEQFAGRMGGEMNQNKTLLYQASTKGDVNSFTQLMSDDPLALARASVTCFDETPLHVAAMLGHVHLARAILGHLPDMALAADSQGRTPLHLASGNGHAEVVRALLSCGPGACLVQDEEGRTPLHLAVMKGQVEVVRELLVKQPAAAEYRLDYGETILHSAVKHNRLRAVKLLVEFAGEEADRFVNARDDDGNTVLHTATTLKQLETIRYLVNNESRVEVNAVNGLGLTSRDILEIMPRDSKSMEIRELLSKAGANLRSTNYAAAVLKNELECSQLDHLPQKGSSMTRRMMTMMMKRRIKSSNNNNNTTTTDQETWLRNNREVLMVTAGVIAAMAYQAGLNPPSGIWQDDGNGHDPGTAIMKDHHPNGYRAFWISNTVAFVTSLSTIFLQVSGITIDRKVLVWILMVIMWITLTCMTIAYSISVVAVSGFDDIFLIPMVVVSVLVWFGVVGFVCLRHFARYLLRYEKNLF